MGTPQLNIKDAEATRLARELAELTGESQTEAVRKALRERLEREKAEREFSRCPQRGGEAARVRESVGQSSKNTGKRTSTGSGEKHADR